MTVVNLGTEGASTFVTTGTIPGGSLNTLMVADASGIAIGTRIIIEVGGEAGGGLMGTVGVGGTWPTLSYLTNGDRNADTSQPDGKYAYVVATGAVSRSFGGAWFPVGAGDGLYAQNFWPKALATTVDGKSGTTLTLHDAATVATTNAIVYFDNYDIINNITQFGSGIADNSQIILPTGTYAIRGALGLAGHNDWEFYGTSKTASNLLFPRGLAAQAHFSGSSNNNLYMHDFGMIGNLRDNGFVPFQLTANETGTIYYQDGPSFVTSPGMRISNVKGTDIGKVINFQSGCDGATADNFEHSLTEGAAVETWGISASDCAGITFRDFTANYATWSPGPEFFRCTNSTMERATTINAMWSMNTSETFLLKDINVTANGADLGANSIFVTGTPLVNINANIAFGEDWRTDEGGTIRNATVTLNGIAATTSGNTGIIINDKNPNVLVDNVVCNMPNYVADPEFGAVGLNSVGANTRVQHFTCRGTTKSPTYKNLMLGGANGTYCDVRVDSIVGGTEDTVCLYSGQTLLGAACM